MVIICRDIGCFMLALFYLENVMGDMQYKMWFSIRVRERYPLPLGVFFCTPPLFNSSLCSCTPPLNLKLCLSVRKCKNLASMVIFSRDIRCFYVGTILHRDLMCDFQYKMWFSVRMRGGIPPLQWFSVHLPFSIFF